MNRDEAYKLLCEMIQNPNLRRHGLAVEAIMRALHNYLKEKHPEMPDQFDEEEWAVVGMLHDADYELVEKDPSRHTLITEEKLKELGVSSRVTEAIKAHHHGIKESRDNILESAVYAADDTSGLITAVSLVQPEKKLATVTVESLMKKFKQNSFAAGARREQILACEEELHIPLQEFLAISLKAMQGVSSELGL